MTKAVTNDDLLIASIRNIQHRLGGEELHIDQVHHRRLLRDGFTNNDIWSVQDLISVLCRDKDEGGKAAELLIRVVLDKEAKDGKDQEES